MASVNHPVLDPGTVRLVGAGSGDPGLLTLRADHADVVLHDVLVNPPKLGSIGAVATINENLFPSRQPTLCIESDRPVCAIDRARG